MILFLCFLPFLVWSQDLVTQSFKTGITSSYFLKQSDFDNTFFYYIPEYQDETISDESIIRRKFKLRVFDYVSSDEDVILDPLDISYEYLNNRNSFQVGFIRYRFSETFGVQLLDVANPRDYSEFIFNDLSWSKRSVFGINDTFKWDSLQVQLILTLWPNGDRMPYRGSAFDLFPQNAQLEGGVIDRPWFKNPEYGVRFNYLFDSGLDASFLYYHHFSRPTSFDVLAGHDFFKIMPTDVLVDSLGNSLSYVIDDWVLRGDFLYTLNDLVQTEMMSYKIKNHAQTLIGLDRNFEKFILGFQHQSDFTLGRHFFGLRTELTDMNNLKPSIMYFKNYQNNDQWLQLKVLYSLNDWGLGLTFDTIEGRVRDQTLFGRFRSQDRFLVDISKSY